MNRVYASRATGVLAASLLVAAATSGCGSAASKVACGRITADLAAVGSQGAGTDPKALKASYESAAAKIRDHAQGTDVADEAEQVAVAMEKLGSQVSGFAANPSTRTPQLDTASLTRAGTLLQNACS
jgi:hypothetical protein